MFRSGKFSPGSMDEMRKSCRSAPGNSGDPSCGNQATHKGKTHAVMLGFPILIMKSRNSVTVPRDNRFQGQTQNLLQNTVIHLAR